MRKMELFHPAIILHIVFFFALTSCNNNAADVPFPERDSAGAQPVTVPLHFSPGKKINWATVKTGGLTPVVKHFDPNTIPATTYDSTDYIPFAAPPVQVHFDWNALPGNDVNINKLPAEPLQFKTSVLTPPVIIKSAKLVRKIGSQYSVFDFGGAQGVSGKFVTQILKDEHGFIWIATEQGLYRYDGENVQVYASITSQVITGLVEDKEGKIWYIQASKLCMLDLAAGTISECTKINTPGNNLTRMFVDSKGLIWLANVIGKGMAIIDPAAKTFKRLQTALGNDPTFGVTEDNDKNIWVTTSGHGLAVINNETGKVKYITRAAGLAGDSLLCVVKDNKGNIWANVTGGGVERLNLKDGIITHYSRPQGVISTFAIDMLFDKNNRLWMSDGNDGFIIVNSDKGYTSHFTRKANITGSFIICLLADNKNRVWIGTNTTGVNIVANDAEATHLIDRANVSTLLEGPPGNIWIGLNRGIEILDVQKKQYRFLTTQQGLSDNNTQSFTLIDGNVWITSDAGLDIYDPVKKTMEHTGKKEGLGGDTIYTILKDNTGAIWLTGPRNGIDVIDAKKTTIMHAGVAEGLDDNGITDIKQDKQGLLWLATTNKGVDVIDPATGTIKYLNKGDGLKGKFNRVLMADSYGRMWIGTGSGVYVADAQNGTLTHITTKEGLPGNSINCINEYNGSVLISTNNKVCIITMPPPAGLHKDTANAKWIIKPLAESEVFVKSVGTFSSNLITSTGQYLWGDFGLSIINKIEPDTAATTTYITGFQLMNQPQYFLNQLHLTSSDTLWSDDKFYTNGQTPAGAGFSSKYGLEWDSAYGPYNLPENLRVPYDQNYMQFNFAEANVGRQDSVFYSYILEGIDKQWSTPTINTFSENYLNLPAGAYTFKVSSRGLNGLWGTPASFSFTIRPPWFKTWWAYTVYIMAILFAVWQFAHYRSRKLVSQNLLLEEKIKQRTDALQQSIEELKTTQTQLVQSEKMASLGELTAGIAHEIQNPLNFVNNFSEVNIELINELKDEMGNITIDDSTKENITTILDDLIQNQEKINYHGKRADSIVKGMLQHSRTGSGHKEPADINALADEYLRLSYHGLRAKDKTFNAKLETNFDDSLPKVNILLQDVGRVLLNLYTNAFYSVMKKKKEGGDANYQPVVSVTTQKVGNQIEIRVRDNGMGIPQMVLDKIYNPFFTTKPTGEGTGLGLSLSYEIITKGHGGTINAETKEGEFAEFIIRLPV